MMLMQTVYKDGNDALSHAYERTFQELQDCLKQRQRLESFEWLTKKQRRDLKEVKTLMPALVGQLAEIHIKMANPSSP